MKAQHSARWGQAGASWPSCLTSSRKAAGLIRALQLLRAAAERGATASAVAENLVKDGRRVRAWLAARNRITVRLAAVLIVPEARFKMRWGTRHAVEHALAAGRLVVVLKPRAKHGDVAEAFEHFRRRGAAVAKDVGEALGVVERYFSQLTGRFKDLWH